MTGAKGKGITWRDWARAWGVNATSPSDPSYPDGWSPVHTLEVLKGLAVKAGVI